MSRYTKITDGASIANVDDTGDPSYYGYSRTDGSWVIQKGSSSGTVYTYAIGRGNYATAWTNRASLTYKRADEWPEM